MDITRKGEVAKGKLIVKNRAYHRKARKVIEGTSERMYTPTASIKTNGVQLVQGFINWSKGASKNKNVKLHEMRTYALKDDVKDIKAVIGIDLGEVCPAAAFAIPTKPSSNNHGTQFIVRRQEIYGNNKKNANWLQVQKDKKDIFSIEEGMAAEGNKQAGTWQQYQGYLHATQNEDNNRIMRNFYNSLSTKRRAWDTKRSIRAAVDRTTHLLLQSASDQGKVLIGIGEDGATAARKARKGAAAPMDTPMRKAIIRQSTARGYHVVRIDEYKTSQICPKCLAKDGKKETTNYLNNRTYRVKRCNQCKTYFHRDGMAAQNQAYIMLSMLEHKQRPEPFVRPSRRTQVPKRKKKRGKRRPGGAKRSKQ